MPFGFSRPGLGVPKKLGLQSFVLFKEPCSLVFGIAQKPEPLLSWGFASLRLFPLQPCKPFQALSSFALSVQDSVSDSTDTNQEPGALEVFCWRTA